MSRNFGLSPKEKRPIDNSLLTLLAPRTRAVRLRDVIPRETPPPLTVKFESGLKCSVGERLAVSSSRIGVATISSRRFYNYQVGLPQLEALPAIRSGPGLPEDFVTF